MSLLADSNSECRKFRSNNQLPKVNSRDDEGNNHEGTVGELNESWESNLEKFNAVIADAKKLVNELKFIHSESVQRFEIGDSDLKYNENQRGLINLQIGKHEQREYGDVMETLKLYREKYDQIKKCASGENPKPVHIVAGELVKELGKSIVTEKPFGHIPGIEIGDAFRFRAELAVVGLHGHFVSGISYVRVDEKVCATSVVESGQYENTSKRYDVLIYSGEGGNPKFKGSASDQKLVRGNLSMVNSMKMRFPVRVIFKKPDREACKALGSITNVYVYGGLYYIKDFFKTRGEHGKLVFKFELHRLSDQPKLSEANAMLTKRMKHMDVCLINDLSQGNETFPVRVVNGVDEVFPPPFTYITKVVYPFWVQHIECVGWNRMMGEECSNSSRYQLEIFRTESRSWGVRSRSYISKESFVCEYIGNILRLSKDQRANVYGENQFQIRKGDYGFALDSTTCGNIARFINHSSSPNLIAKVILNDHGGIRAPRVMLFSSKNIGPLQELTYDYR